MTRSKRFPGLLRRAMQRRRGKFMRQSATALIDKKYPVKVTMDGKMYEERPDGRRRVGVKK